METKYGFTLYTLAEFETWINNLQVGRTIRMVQNHHTYLPDYSMFSGSNHFELQRSMKNHHVQNNGWSDIGQHFTIFPDGKICTGRPLNAIPACIYGNNSMAVCIESLGNFDSGKDVMSSAQKDSIIALNALFCKRFNLLINTNTIVYHHWFDLRTGERTDGAGVTKSCPGTNYFGGNKPVNANNQLIPLVQARLTSQPNGVLPVNLKFFAVVNANRLKVRSGNSTQNQELYQLKLGDIIRVYDEINGWYKISKSNAEYVYAVYTVKVKLSEVTASVLKIRNGAGTQFEQTGTVGKGTQLVVYEEKNGFVRISGHNQWVSATYIKYLVD